MLITGYKRRLGLAGLVAAVVVGGATPRAEAQVVTPISGFNGDLSSSLGVNWVFESGFTGEFVPALTEGSGALKLYANGSWQIGLKLVGGEALANLVMNNDTLQFEAVSDFAMNYRQIVAVFNMNYPSPSTGFHQSPEIALPLPSAEPPYASVVLDLTNINGKNWKQLAQGWLADPNIGGVGSWCELMIVINGDDGVFGPDFGLPADGDVDGGDFLTWQRGFGNDFASPDQGDSNFDGIVDTTDFFDWNFLFGRVRCGPAGGG